MGFRIQEVSVSVTYSFVAKRFRWPLILPGKGSAPHTTIKKSLNKHAPTNTCRNNPIRPDQRSDYVHMHADTETYNTIWQDVHACTCLITPACAYCIWAHVHPLSINLDPSLSLSLPSLSSCTPLGLYPFIPAFSSLPRSLSLLTPIGHSLPVSPSLPHCLSRSLSCPHSLTRSPWPPIVGFRAVSISSKERWGVHCVRNSIGRDCITARGFRCDLCISRLLIKIVL